MESKKFLTNKKGSFIVLAVMIFTALLILIFAVIKVSLDTALNSTVNSLGILWGKSILGEYDLFLKDRYGILGFCGDNYSVEEKLDFYSQYSFAKKKYIKVNSIRASVEDYRLDDLEEFKAQIGEIVMHGIKPVKYKDLDSKNTQDSDRYINSLWIKENLPSFGKAERFYLAEIVSKIKSGIKAEDMINEIATDKYILDFFKTCMHEIDLGKTYFNCEVEYIVSGKLSDKESKKDVKNKITNMRNLLNLYYLYSCPEKRQAIFALAETVTPGPAAILTQAVMMETWAYLEAENDVNILYDKGTVPLLKKDCNWALSLENVFNSNGEVKDDKDSADKKRYISPQTVEGEDYLSYLSLLLCGLTEQTKLLRIMDLIQINGKYLYCGSFLIKDYCFGLEYIIKVNGNEHKFKEIY